MTAAGDRKSQELHLSTCIQLRMTKHSSRKVTNFRHLLSCDTTDARILALHTGRVLNYTVLQKYAYIELKQKLLRSITLDIITRLLDNAAFVCVHPVGRFSKDFSEVHG